MDEEFMAEDASIEDTDHGSHAQLWHSMTAEEDDNWQERLKHGNSRHRSHRHDQYDSEEPFHQLKETDMLWEIGCKVGSEERAVFQILRKSMHPTAPQVLATSALATSVPGRIYAEVNTFAQATTLAQAIPELKPSRISPVPRDELYRILNIASTRLAPHQWARVAGRRRKWRVYGGDTGLVLMIQGSEKLYLALVPRLAIGDADPEVQRPPQALLERLHLAHIKGEKSIKEDIEGRYIWKGYMFSKEGFLLIDLDKIELLPLVETVPRTAELAIFRTTTIIPPRIARRTEEMIRRTRMKLGDRVKVVTGEYLGLIGEITEILEDDSEVNIYMPSQDITQNMLKNDVRVTYRVGDQVKVLDGEHKGLAAWVVAILLDSLRILNLEKQIEVNVSKADVEFHSPKHSISLKPRDGYPNWAKLGERNANDVYIGKRVMVIARNAMKGYRGVIKSTTPDGCAFVELDALLRQANLKVKLLSLTCLTDEDMPSFCESTSGSSMLDRNQTPLEDLPSSPSAGRAPADPAWDPSSQTPSNITRPTGPVHWLDDPAWDLSSQNLIHTVRPTRPVHWLDDPALMGLRVKLRSSEPIVRSPVLEFMGVENGKVRVRDMGDYRNLPFESISPLPPMALGDLVTPNSGELRGTFFKVIEMTGDLCIVRKPGMRPRKRFPDPSFLTANLLQVFPPFKTK
ncbi:hypothetical protein BJ912DRAFT_687982 [Pholiota molesta]|nr:hypothetical protein BJ912DRAFT_687982 [Pholiota molesta]